MAIEEWLSIARAIHSTVRVMTAVEVMKMMRATIATGIPQPNGVMMGILPPFLKKRPCLKLTLPAHHNKSR